MSAREPRPTDTTNAARAVLVDTALPDVEGRYGVAAATVGEIAQLGVEQSLGVLGASPSAHAGWALLLSGATLARNAEELSPPGAGPDADPSFEVGVAWAGVIVGAVGDRMLQSDEAAGPASAPPAPTADGGPERVRALARELTDSVLAPGSTPPDRRRFADEAIAGLDAGILELDHGLAGWVLCAVGGWAASRADDITAPLNERRGLLRRTPQLPRVSAGCGYAGALLAQTGLILLESS